MSVRDFTDSRGNAWRVWDVGPEQIHPATRGEDFLLGYGTGWLVFECRDEKRRLAAPYPADWVTFADAELERLAQRATPVKRASASLQPFTARERTFSSPRGREWTVGLHECEDRNGQRQIVLRFTAEDVVVDVEHWPHGWASLSPAEYALLMLDANPPRVPGRSGPQRRRTDRPSLTA